MTTSHFPIHQASIPYTQPPTPLQTLDIWLPPSHLSPNPSETTWIIYIHGGAWRDPSQTSSCILSTLPHIPPSILPSIAGLASINYRLSPYTNHATDPSSPDEASRNVTHPAHIKDVACAIRFLREKHNVDRWVGIGHSCGATLLLQLVSRIGIREEGRIAWPEGLILFEGIYDIPLLLRNHEPPHCAEGIAKIYNDIVVGAFGPEESAWKNASPVAGDYKAMEEEGPRYISLAYSLDDELVESEQRDAMLRRLEECGWNVGPLGDEDGGKKIVELRDLKGSHDFIWEDGRQIAEEITRVVEGLFHDRGGCDF